MSNKGCLKDSMKTVEVVESEGPLSGHVVSALPGQMLGPKKALMTWRSSEGEKSGE